MKYLKKIISAIEDTPLSLTTFVTAFFALIIARLTVENTLGLFEERSFFFYFFEFTHTFLFFLCSFLLILPLVRYAGHVDFRKAANVLLFGFLIILTPPIIDTIVFQGQGFWSFYEFDGIRGLIVRFFTLFGDSPDIGITYGVRVEVVVTSILLGLYAYLKSDRVAKALLMTLATYAVLFVLGTFPSWITLGLLTFQKGFFAINANDVAALFLTPERVYARDLSDFRSVLNAKMSIVYSLFALLLIALTLWQKFPKYFIALWRNARLPQLTWHGGLLFLGMGLAIIFADGYLPLDFFHITGAIVILAAVESAWLASVIANDLYDTRIDEKTNPKRPLIEETIPPELYKIFGFLFFAASLLLGGIMSFPAALLLLSYQALAWIYSAPPFRLKRFPIIATLLAAAAGILILAIGFLMVSPDHNLSHLPLPLLTFLFLAYALCIPLKDFKDIDGDRADHVYTIPVLLGAPLAKLLIGSLMLLFYIISPLVLHAPKLLFPALLFGSLTFWAMQRGTPEEASFFAFRKLPRIILTLVILYGATLAAILF